MVVPASATVPWTKPRPSGTTSLCSRTGTHIFRRKDWVFQKLSHQAPHLCHHFSQLYGKQSGDGVALARRPRPRGWSDCELDPRPRVALLQPHVQQTWSHLQGPLGTGRGLGEQCHHTHELLLHAGSVTRVTELCRFLPSHWYILFTITNVRGRALKCF